MKWCWLLMCWWIIHKGLFSWSNASSFLHLDYSGWGELCECNLLSVKYTWIPEYKYFSHFLLVGDFAQTFWRSKLILIAIINKPFLWKLLSFRLWHQTEKSLYIVTEPVTTLAAHLKLQAEKAGASDLEVSWGFHQIVVSCEVMD